MYNSPLLLNYTGNNFDRIYLNKLKDRVKRNVGKSFYEPPTKVEMEDNRVIFEKNLREKFKASEE